MLTHTRLCCVCPTCCTARLANLATHHSHHSSLVQVGWRHQETVAELEAKRKVKAAAYYEAKKKLRALRAKAEAQVGSQ